MMTGYGLHAQCRISNVGIVKWGEVNVDRQLLSRQVLLVTGLLVGAGRLGSAASTLIDDVALVHGITLIGGCMDVSAPWFVTNIIY